MGFDSIGYIDGVVPRKSRTVTSGGVFSPSSHHVIVVLGYSREQIKMVTKMPEKIADIMDMIDVNASC